MFGLEYLFLSVVIIILFYLDLYEKVYFEQIVLKLKVVIISLEDFDFIFFNFLFVCKKKYEILKK